MTESEFYEDKNVSKHSDYYWLRKIVMYLAQPDSTTEFVQLPASNNLSATIDAQGKIVVKINSITVEMEGHFNRSSLKSVLKVLEEM